MRVPALTLPLGVALLAISSTIAGGPARAADKPLVGMIEPQADNPFYVKMLEGANKKAEEVGVRLQNIVALENDAQVAAIENLVSAGAKTILLVPMDTKAIVPAVKKARDAGVLVISIDHPVDPANAADATMATDNFEAGVIIGEWAAKTLGAKAATAKIAMLDNDAMQTTVDVARDHGFLKGFGIAYDDPNRNGSEHDPRVVGHAVTNSGTVEGGRTGMENLLQKNPDINVVYTINELVAAGAHAALQAASKTDVLIVSVDGGCSGVRNIKAGVIGATAMQFPLLMASMGVQAGADFAKSGKKPEATPSLNFINTGVKLITDHPVAGLDSVTSEEGLKLCWG
jgi:fructose transport system substrate-binding protein